MSKKTLWKDIRKSFTTSWGRFFSILLLMMLGSFALVGLWIAGPDMRATGETYFKQYHLADLTVIGEDGLDAHDQKTIQCASGTEQIEFGYLKDVTLKGTHSSFRILSKPTKISLYRLDSGRMPKATNEIAIDANYKSKYKLGDTIKFVQRADQTGSKVLKRISFKVVGFVYSPEIISSINKGNSTSGSGDLKGYGVVTSNNFDSDVYMMARLTYRNTKGLDPYSSQYTDRIQAHKTALNHLLQNAPQARLAAIKKQYQAKIDAGQKKLDDAKAQLNAAQEQLTTGAQQLATAKQQVAAKQQELDAGVKNGQAQIASGETQLQQASTQLSQSRQQLTTAKQQLVAGQQQLDDKHQALVAAKQQLDAAKQQLDNSQQQLATAKQQLTTGQQQLNAKQQDLTTAKQQLNAAKQQLDASQQQLTIAKQKIDAALAQNPAIAENPAFQQQQASYQAGVAQYNGGLKTYNQNLAVYNQNMANWTAASQELAKKISTYQSGTAQYSSGLATYNQNLETYNQNVAAWTAANQQLQQKSSEFNAGEAQLQQGQEQYASKQAALAQAKKQLAATQQSGQQQLDAANQEIVTNEATLKTKQAAYDKQSPSAQKKIQAGTVTLEDAKEALSKLEAPTYTVDTRRETPTGQGYTVYDSTSNIVDSLANIFPFFMYFVAALVTFTTMTRFVDEERINSGTLVALGYTRRDVINKFTMYGFLASLIGSLLGITAGHIILPMIVYQAYHNGINVPPIELHFYPGISAVALLLAMVSAVLPAWWVASRELNARPAELMLPKPPANGSKIFLERIPFIWRRLSFTHKVTARNIFRYKKRMFMTIFGVAGSVTLLFAGLAVQHSISGVNDRQFNDIIKYDMIVAQKSNITDKQQQQLDQLFQEKAVERTKSVYYETVTKNAGTDNDRQDITMIVPKDQTGFSDYIRLATRQGQTKLTLSNDGAVISERLASLLNVKIGSTIMVKDATGTKHQVKVTGITEMYMGHFLFMNKTAYQKAFNTDFKPNGRLVTLKNRSISNTRAEAAKFMQAGGVEGIQQNSALRSQITTIVHSLNTIMIVLIILAAVLGVVILYNLTNINVAERMRELSTIKVLGFYNQEVTMYIYRETILLSIFGIFVGWGLGELLHEYIITVVPPNNVMFNPALSALTFIMQTLVITIITIALGFFVNSSLKKVDMLAALKSVD